MNEIDCGDHSCEFAENKTGMRTNGGCRCWENLGASNRTQLLKIRLHVSRLKARVRELEKNEK